MPEEDHFVETGTGDIEEIDDILPVTHRVQLVAAVDGGPASGSTCSSNAVLPGDNIHAGGHQEGTQVVAATLALSLPVEADGILAGSGGTESFIDRHIAGGASDSVFIGSAVVVRDVEGTAATAMGGAAEDPLVGVGAVHQRPGGVQSGILEAGDVGHRHGVDDCGGAAGDGHKLTQLGSADGGHADAIERGGGKTREGVGSGGSIDRVENCTGGILEIDTEGGTLFSAEAEADFTVGGVGDGQDGRMQAGRCGMHIDIIDKPIPRSAAHIVTHGDAGTGRGAGEGHLILHVGGTHRHGDVEHLDERSGRRGIGHVSHAERTAAAGALGAGPESHLKTAGDGVERRKHQNMVVATVAVGIETHAVAGVCTGGLNVHIAASSDVAPAGNGGGAGGGGHTVEILGPRQGGDGTAIRAERTQQGVAGVAVANSAHTDLILGVGTQRLQNNTVVGNIDTRPCRVGGGAVFDIIGIAGAGPRKFESVGRNIVGRQVLRHQAVGSHMQVHIVDIGIVVATGGGSHLVLEEEAEALAGSVVSHEADILGRGRGQTGGGGHDDGHRVIDGVGGGVVGVEQGHDYTTAVSAGAVSPDVEAHLHIDIVQFLTHHGHHGVAVHAVHVAAVQVHIQILVVAGSADIRIFGRSAVVVVDAPAGVELDSAAGRAILEVHHIGQAADSAASRAEVARQGKAGIPAAESAHADVIRGAGIQGREDNIGVAHFDTGPSCRARHSVLNQPAAAGALPRKVEGVGADIVGHQVLRHHAVGSHMQVHIVNIGIEVATGGGSLLVLEEEAEALAGRLMTHEADIFGRGRGHTGGGGDDDGHRVIDRVGGSAGGIEQGHNHTTAVSAGAAAPDIEAHLHIDIVQLITEHGHHGVTILTVHVTAVVQIHVQVLASVSGSDIRIVVRGASGVIDAPAGVELDTAAGRAILKVLHKGQGRDGAAGSAL